MQNIAIILILTLGLLSCRDKTENSEDNKSLSAEQQNTKWNKLKLDFNQPVLIDSSIYVMYPLTLEHADESEKNYAFSSPGRSTTCWNIIFYNTESGQYHLLNDSLKMVIHSYGPRKVNEDASPSSSSLKSDNSLEGSFKQVDRLLYFSIATTDCNKDGKLNSDDPNYLFISDKAGRHFKQISPDNVNVNSWETIKGTNKILLMATKDTNGDKIFDEKDESIPLVYDLTRNTTSTELFDDAFKLKLKMQIDDKWTK